MNNSIDRKTISNGGANRQHSRIRYTHGLVTHQPSQHILEQQEELIQPQVHYQLTNDLKQKIFFAKTAKNFYNMAKGYWRPANRKAKKVKIET